MWTSPDRKAPADSLADFFEELARRGWHVTGWSAELDSYPVLLGAHWGLPQCISGLQDGTITVHIAPKPQPAKFRRKLRRYDYRQRRKPKPKAADEDGYCTDCGLEDCECTDAPSYCETCNDYH